MIRQITRTMMEGLIDHAIGGYSKSLSNWKYNVRITKKKSSGDFYFVKFKVNYASSKELLLWSVIKVDSRPKLLKVEEYIKFLKQFVMCH